jgi:hypothetical protein
MKQVGATTTVVVNTPSTSQVRQWARQQGVPVGDRGRIPADLVAQYLAAHRRGGSPPEEPAGKPRRAPAPRARSGVAIGITVNAKPRWDWNR